MVIGFVLLSNSLGLRLTGKLFKNLPVIRSKNVFLTKFGVWHFRDQNFQFSSLASYTLILSDVTSRLHESFTNKTLLLAKEGEPLNVITANVISYLSNEFHL